MRPFSAALFHEPGRQGLGKAERGAPKEQFGDFRPVVERCQVEEAVAFDGLSNELGVRVEGGREDVLDIGFMEAAWKNGRTWRAFRSGCGWRRLWTGWSRRDRGGAEKGGECEGGGARDGPGRRVARTHRAKPSKGPIGACRERIRLSCSGRARTRPAIQRTHDRRAAQQSDAGTVGESLEKLAGVACPNVCVKGIGSAHIVLRVRRRLVREKDFDDVRSRRGDGSVQRAPASLKSKGSGRGD